MSSPLLQAAALTLERIILSLQLIPHAIVPHWIAFFSLSAATWNLKVPFFVLFLRRSFSGDFSGNYELHGT